jgi:hypothetical protein
MGGFGDALKNISLVLDLLKEKCGFILPEKVKNSW